MLQKTNVSTLKMNENREINNYSHVAYFMWNLKVLVTDKCSHNKLQQMITFEHLLNGNLI